MAIEYHGWVALAASNKEWDDGDLENGYCQVEQLLAQLNPEEGHWGLLTSGTFLPRMVYLNNIEADSIDIPKDTIKSIVAVFDQAYGELAVFGDPTSKAWTISNIDRYVLAAGKLELLTTA